MTHVAQLLTAIAFCLALSFLLSGMEAGLFALNRLKVRQEKNTGKESARVLYGFLEKPENFLWTIVVGNSLSNLTAVGLLMLLFYEWIESSGILLFVLLLGLGFLMYAIADLLPKMLFRQFPNRLCLRSAVPFRLVHLAVSPAVGLLAWLSDLVLAFTGSKRFSGKLFGNRDELRMVMQESSQSLTSEERKMVNRVLDLQSHTVGDLAVPIERVVTVTLQTPVREVLELCRTSNLTRLPVREQASGRIVGIINLGSILYLPAVDAEKRAMAFVQPAAYFETHLRLEVALQRFRKTRQRMAIVLNPEGREIGILTLEDILRFLVGQVAF